QLQLLCGAGLTPADAARALVALGQYVVGSAIEQQADEQDHGERSAASGEPAVLPPLLAQAFAAFEQASPDDVFEYGLALLLEGLAARISPPQLT
ncbi:MAG: Transcriptional regulator, TetR family, partial [Akkermansiaceae bacterium]|nr:Transcriptional regulator, TetR family [Akkermansiaceae bacterium]